MKYKLVTQSKKLLADTLTPVNIYLKLRDVFAGSILLESSDYHGHENSLSFICCDPLSSFIVTNKKVEAVYPDGVQKDHEITQTGEVTALLDMFKNSFEVEGPVEAKYGSGLFGYIAYDAVSYFEDVVIDKVENRIPDILYKLYRYVIVVDHFSNELTLLEYLPEGTSLLSGLEKVEKIIFSNRFATYNFSLTTAETSNVDDASFLKIIEKGKEHCYRGDVFQIVLSRRFSCGFKGDEFNVYRALRSINPSPYLFYFDYGNFKLIGSSPEAQLQITSDKKAHIFPIAGTFRRTGNDQEDAVLASKLAADEKENAEHVMLVDLARNDMSRNAEHVTVDVFKEIQFYSHVIHLVSKVTGTLSGAPKHMAMTLINKYENVNRGFYGGAIGFLGFDGSFNHAIMIRTFLSNDNKLIYQAGAGVVSKSEATSELQEVNNKLEALRKAVVLAEKI
jgi:anthranilate synthase component I